MPACQSIYVFLSNIARFRASLGESAILWTPTEHFAILEPQYSQINVSEQHKIHTTIDGFQGL